MIRTVRTLCFGIVAAAAVPAAAFAGPAIATDWFESTLSQDTCFARAEQALTTMGLNTIERTRFSRFAQAGDYTMQVRCIAEKGMVLVITAGPDRPQVQAYQAKLVALF
jgi:hypothetical protein